MAGMYEKLGDLLNETLEAGRVKFVRVERTEEPGPAESAAADSTGGRRGDGDFASSFYRAEREAEKRYFKTSGNDAGEGRRIIYRRITPELENAYSLLGLGIGAGKEDVRRAYKEKLLSYHPDRYAGKELMEKIANDKTRKLVSAYRLILESLG